MTITGVNWAEMTLNDICLVLLAMARDDPSKIIVESRLTRHESLSMLGLNIEPNGSCWLEHDKIY